MSEEREQYNPGRLLSLADVLRAIGSDKSADRQAMDAYVKIAEVRTILGAIVEGKNIRYPERSLPLFRDLLVAREAGEVTPKSVVHVLRLIAKDAPPIGTMDADFTTDEEPAQETAQDFTGPGSALVPILAQTERVAITFADTIIQRIEQSGILLERAPVEDRIIGREEAATLLYVSPRAVGRHVKPVRKDRWSRNMILEHIAQLRAKAEGK